MSWINAIVVLFKNPWITSFLAIVVFLKLLSKLRKNGSASKSLPPGPPGWPLIGNMLDLGQVPHRTLQKLLPKYGPVIWLRLGSVNTMVVQSAEAAAELFKKCDLPFADRKVPDSLTALDYCQVWLSNPYGQRFHFSLFN